uniref:Exportin-T n=1 Tax=Strigamia maritima TaxID=126957 RepID=T1JL81_STRMM
MEFISHSSFNHRHAYNLPYVSMDCVALQGLGPRASAEEQARALQYFESLKAAENGWQLCISALLSGSYGNEDQVKFFCFQVIEQFVKTRYERTDAGQQNYLREFLLQWIQCNANKSEKPFVKNKVAQILALLFLMDYPHKWHSYFSDVLQTLKFGPRAVDVYLRVLMAIDSEVVDREIVHSAKEIERNTMLKDQMRELCLPSLVNSWYTIITTYETTNVELTGQCLNVIGAYVSWIDINLIANDQFVNVLLRFLSNRYLREAACDCIHEIVSKGMDPVAKTKLSEEDSEFNAKLAKLINGIGCNLVLSWQKLFKAGDVINANITQQSIEEKMSLALQFLTNEFDDVSIAVIDFVRDYVQMIKQISNLKEPQVANIEATIYIVIKKYKYDKSYNFTNEGEDEVAFQEYRKQLKVLFDNLAQVNRELVLRWVQEFVRTTLQNWQSCSFEDVESAIGFLYLLGEAIPASHGNHFNGSETKVTAMQEMMSLLVSCNVSQHSHYAVSLQFFETITRYEKFFNYEPQHIPDVLAAFLDHRGLHHANGTVVSRTAYLFSRFIKSLKVHMQHYTPDILRRLQDLLAISPVIDNHMVIPSPDDQLFLYETAAVLIVSSNFESQEKQILMKNLLLPVMGKFTENLERLVVETDRQTQADLAEFLSHAMAVTSRTSKAFSNQQTMKTCGCVQAYLDALQVFLPALEIPHQQAVLQSAIRQFLHRMVVCLEEEILPYIPSAAERLLKHSDIRSIQEFIPLINQIISKFKKEIVPFLQRIFMPLVRVIFNALTQPIDESDQHAVRDKQTLQRSYFLFISAILTNGVDDVIASQDVGNVREILLTIIQGVVTFPDPVAQKTCFNILRKLVELWGGNEGLIGFEEFMYQNIVPACFMAPMKESFDLSDAQTTQALFESALCLRTILDKRGDDFVRFLQNEYLPTLDVSPQLIQEYCQALKSDSKMFKNYLKLFFQRAKS